MSRDRWAGIPLLNNISKEAVRMANNNFERTVCHVQGCKWSHLCSSCNASVPDSSFVDDKDGKDWFECPKCGADILVPRPGGNLEADR